jgi:hypothetical protein
VNQKGWDREVAARLDSGKLRPIRELLDETVVTG